MNDHIMIAKHKDTGLYHALLYVNHPTPSGCDRPILKLSTTNGKPSEREALDLMLSGLTPEYINMIDVPKLEEPS